VKENKNNSNIQIKRIIDKILQNKIHIKSIKIILTQII